MGVKGETDREWSRVEEMLVESIDDDRCTSKEKLSSNIVVALKAVWVGLVKGIRSVEGFLV